MCVIVHAKAKKMLKDNVLKQCWDKNPHGAGFVWLDDGVVHFYKGCMTFRFFQEKFNELVSDDAEVLIHFRYSTHGKIVPYLTHPFPLVKSERELMVMLEGKAEVPLLFHNGVLAVENEFYMSDTAVLARNLAGMDDESKHSILEAESEGYFEYDKKGQKRFVPGGSKFILVYPDGRIKRFGRFVEDEGVWFSNLNWKPTYYNLAYGVWKNRNWKSKKKEKPKKESLSVYAQTSPPPHCKICEVQDPEIYVSGLWMCRDCFERWSSTWDGVPTALVCELCDRIFYIDDFGDVWDEFLCPECRMVMNS